MLVGQVFHVVASNAVLRRPTRHLLRRGQRLLQRQPSAKVHGMGVATDRAQVDHQPPRLRRLSQRLPHARSFTHAFSSNIDRSAEDSKVDKSSR